MTSRIYLLQHNGTIQPLDQQPYDSEALLQRLLAEHPDILAGEQINADAPPRLYALDDRTAQQFSLMEGEAKYDPDPPSTPTCEVWRPVSDPATFAQPHQSEAPLP